MGKLKNTAVWIVFGLLAIGLMGFGTGQFSNRIDEIGHVGGKPITVQSYGGQLQNQMRALEAQANEPVTFAMAQQAGLDRAVLGRLVRDRVIDNETAQLGLSVGDEAVAQQLTQVDAFKGLDGKFDPEAYRFALDRQNLKVDEFEDSLRDDMSRSLFQAAVLSGVAHPTTFADVVLTYIQQTRTISWAPITGADLESDLPGATEDDLKAYYEEHIALFTKPEARAVSYASLTPADLQDQMEIDETALRGLYTDRADQYQQPERRLVERLVFADEASATAAATAIVAGAETLESLVEARGLDLSDIDMGDVSKTELGEAGDGVFAAEAGSIVGPLPTALGPALFRVNIVLPAESTSYEDALPELREDLAAEAARRAIVDRRDSIDDLIAGGATIEDLAERTDMVAGSFVWGGDGDSAIAGYASVREAIGALTEGALPQLVETDDGGLVALRLDGVTPPQPIPYDEAKASVLNEWRGAELDKMIVERTEAIASELREGKTMEGLGLRVQTAEAVGRRQVVPGTPDSFVQLAFDTEPGDIATVMGPSVGVVFRVESLGQQSLPEADQANARAQVAARAAQGISEDIMTAVTNSLRSRTEVVINQQALNAVNGQFQ